MRGFADSSWSSRSLHLRQPEAHGPELLVPVATLPASGPVRRPPSVLLRSVATAVLPPAGAWAPWLRESWSLPPCKASCRHTKQLIRLRLGTMIAFDNDESLRRQAHQTIRSVAMYAKTMSANPRASANWHCLLAAQYWCGRGNACWPWFKQRTASSLGILLAGGATGCCKYPSHHARVHLQA